jgi:hypothetical protein
LSRRRRPRKARSARATTAAAAGCLRGARCLGHPRHLRCSRCVTNAALRFVRCRLRCAARRGCRAVCVHRSRALLRSRRHGRHPASAGGSAMRHARYGLASCEVLYRFGCRAHASSSGGCAERTRPRSGARRGMGLLCRSLTMRRRGLAQPALWCDRFSRHPGSGAIDTGAVSSAPPMSTALLRRGRRGLRARSFLGHVTRAPCGRIPRLPVCASSRRAAARFRGKGIRRLARTKARANAHTARRACHAPSAALWRRRPPDSRSRVAASAARRHRVGRRGCVGGRRIVDAAATACVLVTFCETTRKA